MLLSVLASPNAKDAVGSRLRVPKPCPRLLSCHRQQPTVLDGETNDAFVWVRDECGFAVVLQATSWRGLTIGIPPRGISNRRHSERGCWATETCPSWGWPGAGVAGDQVPLAARTPRSRMGIATDGNTRSLCCNKGLNLEPVPTTAALSRSSDIETARGGVR
ncbi:hypothetical protein VTI74DRAFT_54 [Chaetomium olivicolor]